MSRYFLGLTGASGHVYGRALARALLAGGHELDLCATEAGCKVLRHELDVDVGAHGERWTQALPQYLERDPSGAVRTFLADQVEAPPSSGTALSGGVVLVPCSVGTLGRVAYGLSSNLIERAADVALKERRKLVLVVREAPLSALHLENLLRMAQAGAVVLPASPGFYHRPKDLDQLVGHLVGKILDALGVSHSGARWRGFEGTPADPQLPPRREPGT
jgi:4-hydroxy-3-polyprenylbenzoate decarboxylase